MSSISVCLKPSSKGVLSHESLVTYKSSSTSILSDVEDNKRTKN
jgi:hypothetical protein